MNSVVIAAKEFKLALASLKAALEAAKSEFKQDVRVCLLKFDDTCCQLVFSKLGIRAMFKLAYLEKRGTGNVFLDLDTLLSIKPTKDVEIQAFPNYIEFASGNIKLTLPQAALDEPFDLSVKETIRVCDLPTKPFLAALACHSYGAHHNPVEAARRSVKLAYNPETKMFELSSSDKQVSCLSWLGSDIGSDSPVTLLPKPLEAVLAVLPDDTFSLSVGKQSWRVATASFEVCFPNLVKTSERDVPQIVAQMQGNHGIRIALATSDLNAALTVLANLIKVSKNEMAKVRVMLVGLKDFLLKGETSKIKDIEVKVETCRIIKPDSMTISGKENVFFNLKYLKEFVEAAGSGKEVTIEWWEHLDSKAPVKGKAITVYNDQVQYIMARMVI